MNKLIWFLNGFYPESAIVHGRCSTEFSVQKTTGVDNMTDLEDGLYPMWIDFRYCFETEKDAANQSLIEIEILKNKLLKIVKK